MSSVVIYKNRRAAREAVGDLAQAFTEHGFYVSKRWSHGHDAAFVFQKGDFSVDVAWIWDGGLTVTCPAQSSTSSQAEVLAVLSQRGVREEQVI